MLGNCHPAVAKISKLQQMYQTIQRTGQYHVSETFPGTSLVHSFTFFRFPTCDYSRMYHTVVHYSNSFFPSLLTSSIHRKLCRNIRTYRLQFVGEDAISSIVHITGQMQPASHIHTTWIALNDPNRSLRKQTEVLHTGSHKPTFLCT